LSDFILSIDVFSTVSEYECHLLTNEEFKMIHSFGSKDDMFIKIGAIASDPLVPISIGVNKLFASHIGIFGNTGSGK
jgi:hypothetical protein